MFGVLCTGQQWMQFVLEAQLWKSCCLLFIGIKSESDAGYFTEVLVAVRSLLKGKRVSVFITKQCKHLWWLKYTGQGKWANVGGECD